MTEALSQHREFVALAERRKAFGQAVGWWWQENYGYNPEWPDNLILSHFGGPINGGWLEPNVKGWWMSRHDKLEGVCPECVECIEHCTCRPSPLEAIVLRDPPQSNIL